MDFKHQKCFVIFANSMDFYFSQTENPYKDEYNNYYDFD